MQGGDGQHLLVLPVGPRFPCMLCAVHIGQFVAVCVAAKLHALRSTSRAQWTALTLLASEHLSIVVFPILQGACVKS